MINAPIRNGHGSLLHSHFFEIVSRCEAMRTLLHTYSCASITFILRGNGNPTPPGRASAAVPCAAAQPLCVSQSRMRVVQLRGIRLVGLWRDDVAARTVPVEIRLRDHHGIPGRMIGDDIDNYAKASLVRFADPGMQIRIGPIIG
jgi:hypothetical protein